VKNRNNLECALSEAAYLTGLERNAEVVRMASYAPLFANTEAWQWTPNLIWVDSLRLSCTPNYYVQQMYARNRGDVILPVEMDAGSAKLYASAVRDNQTGEVILKVVNARDAVADVQLNFAGLTKVAPQGLVTVLTGALHDENTVGKADKVRPVETRLNLAGPMFTYAFPAHSFTVLRLGH